MCPSFKLPSWKWNKFTIMPASAVQKKKNAIRISGWDFGFRTIGLLFRTIEK